MEFNKRLNSYSASEVSVTTSLYFQILITRTIILFIKKPVKDKVKTTATLLNRIERCSRKEVLLLSSFAWIYLNWIIWILSDRHASCRQNRIGGHDNGWRHAFWWYLFHPLKKYWILYKNMFHNRIFFLQQMQRQIF